MFRRKEPRPFKYKIGQKVWETHFTYAERRVIIGRYISDGGDNVYIITDSRLKNSTTAYLVTEDGLVLANE